MYSRMYKCRSHLAMVEMIKMDIRQKESELLELKLDLQREENLLSVEKSGLHLGIQPTNLPQFTIRN